MIYKHTVPCQGGFCSSREKCANYHADSKNNPDPPDRLCDKVERPNVIRSYETEKVAA